MFINGLSIQSSDTIIKIHDTQYTDLVNSNCDVIETISHTKKLG